MRQYWSVKEKYLDQLLFFRLGDFYELFFDDALIASRELELTLTGKECGLEERAPMCGIPYHSSESYIAKLVKKGYKVAICEQVEDPATAKGLVKREIIRAGHNYFFIFYPMLFQIRLSSKSIVIKKMWKYGNDDIS